MNAANEQTGIEVSSLSKRYRRGTVANDGISLARAPGECFGMLGPNGAGKTTLVRQITGELTPSSGQIRVFGIDAVKRPKEARRLLGIVPQEAGLFDYLTVREHLLYFGRLKGLKGESLANRVKRLMRELTLEEHGEKRASELSGGFKRKVLVGIAMLSRPRALILDEPTTGLDPHARREVWELVRRCQQDEVGVLLTTHYMEEAECLSDRIGIISQGQLLAVGTMQELRERITSRFKLTYTPTDSDGLNHERVTVYGRSVDELRARVNALQLEEYDLAKTNLEDIYLELTESPLTLEADHDTMAQ